MNRQLEMLLQLQELALMCKAREMLQPNVVASAAEPLEQRIRKLRQKLPGPLISEFDALMHGGTDAVVACDDGMCLGCHQTVAAQLRTRVEYSRDMIRCNHCGRFLYAVQRAPRYLGAIY